MRVLARRALTLVCVGLSIGIPVVREAAVAAAADGRGCTVGATHVPLQVLCLWRVH